METSKKKIKIFFTEIIETIIGAIIMAIATSLILLPNQLSSGGFAGIATIFYYFLNIPMGTTILSINIPLFIFAAYKLGKGFVIRSFIGTVTFSFSIDILDRLQPLTQDRFLACIYGGIIIGLGTAIILKANSSTGGSDLISMLVKKYNPNIRTGNVIIIVDVIIVGLNVLLFKEIEIGLYSAIAIYLMGKMIDIIFEGLYGKGMYKDEQTLVLLCAASRGDVVRVKQTAKKIDPESFIIIANAREVVGLGFKK